MLDNNESNACKEIIDLINNNNEKIVSLQEQLELSETRRETAEKMLTEIKKSVSGELQEAYKSGYNAALNGSTNPAGGTTISNETNKTLVLSNQN